MASTTVSPKNVSDLRARTGAGMMDCKRALEESGGDMEKASEILRKKGIAKAEKRSGKTASQGLVVSYIHHNHQVGVLLELNCETDFVARNDDFIAFARDVALHIAASPLTRYVSEDEIPQDDKDAELRIFAQQAADKPERVQEQIAQGKLKAWMEDVVLLNQVHVNTEKYEKKTIEQIRAELSGKTGENVVIRRFSRFAVGA
jgi:elongation factor Ts